MPERREIPAKCSSEVKIEASDSAPENSYRLCESRKCARSGNHEFDQLALRFGAGTILHGQSVLLDARSASMTLTVLFKASHIPGGASSWLSTRTFGPNQ